MARIIRFNPDRHQETLTLLPWYIGGQLADEERARIEAHLAGCAECQSELRLERRLAGAVADLPFQADHGWEEMRRRIEETPRAEGRLKKFAQSLAGSGRAGWMLAAQFVLVVFALGLVLPLSKPAQYHALSAPKPATAGDIIVIFRPDARAEDLARVVRASGSRLVDGPTAADAYVLAAPSGARAAALHRLRAEDAVTLAEPIDSAERR
jgi:anti-sigma factor RsiW